MLKAVSGIGMPRGLIWKRLSMTDDATIMTMPDGLKVALAAMTVEFEPVPGSDMEFLPLAREPRCVVAVFHLLSGEWQPRLPVIFNHTVQQVVERKMDLR